MGMAVSVGARITSHRARPLLSANSPIKGLNSAGICIIVDNNPAWLKVKESYSIIRGSRGARQLV